MDSAVATTWEEAFVFAHPLLDQRERRFQQAPLGARAVQKEQVPDLAVPERSGQETQVVHEARRTGMCERPCRRTTQEPIQTLAVERGSVSSKPKL
jgi:hypothetical protein